MSAGHQSMSMSFGICPQVCLHVWILESCSACLPADTDPCLSIQEWRLDCTGIRGAKPQHCMVWCCTSSHGHHCGPAAAQLEHCAHHQCDQLCFWRCCVCCRLREVSSSQPGREAGFEWHYGRCSLGCSGTTACCALQRWPVRGLSGTTSDNYWKP